MKKNSVVYGGGARGLIDAVFRDGYVLINKFFDIDTVLRAREEMLALLSRDLAERKVSESKLSIRMDRGAYKTSLTPLMHSRLFPSWENHTYSRMLEDMFSSSVISDFLCAIVGDYYRLRVDLVRRSTGVDDTVDDFQIPHEWHRDTPGEFTFGIFFDDFSSPASGGTAVIPGTHLEKFDPRWDLLLSEKGRPHRDDFLSGRLRYVPSDIYKMAFWNQQVRAELRDKPVEIRGRVGDIYFFLNDTWHGRFPNRSARKLMISRVGGFPSDFEFKNDICLPGGVERLPHKLQGLYGDKHPVNVDSKALVRRILFRESLADSREKAAKEKAELMKRFYSSFNL